MWVFYMKKLHNKKLMKKYIEIAGTMPTLCKTKEELSDSLDNLLMSARDEGMSDNDYNQLSIAFKFFKSIVYRRNKSKEVKD